MLKKLVKIGFCFFFLSASAWGQEICNNAVDDDGDGLIDLNDNDCDCNSLIDLSLIPNPSFEDTLCCPEAEEMMTCAENWIQASEATTDYYNLCGFSELSFIGAVPPALPLPGGGEGFIGLYNFLGGYREYAGACTSSPLLGGVSYTLNMQSAYAYGGEDELALRLYGTPDCTDLPWAGTECPDGVGGWVLLAETTVTYALDGTWQPVTFTFTPPVDMAAIAFGTACIDLGDTPDSYFYFDELVLVDTETFGYMDTAGGWCSEDLELIPVTDDLGGTWQWYKEGVALIGETGTTLNPVPYGDGMFAALYTYAGGCRLIEYASPVRAEADFEAGAQCLGETTEFVNTSTNIWGEIDTWGWDFNDGFLSNIESPAHTYATHAVYDVELVAISPDLSCNDTMRKPVTVFAIPEVDFELTGDGVVPDGDDWRACSGVPLQFNDLTTIDGPISFASWNWSFGTGDNDATQNPVYTYSESDDYTVWLKVISENGCADSTSAIIRLTGITANFRADSVCFGEVIFFADLSVSEGGSTVSEWLWRMDYETDSSLLQHPAYEYETPGNYEVSLTVSNTEGCVDSVAKTVVVHALPDPNFYASENPTDYFNTELRLTIIYPDDESAYTWEMPGGFPETSNVAPIVTVAYPEFVADTHWVTLREVSEFGCIDSVTHAIVILEDQQVFAPNAFTPNGDPFNQNWRVYVEGLEPLEYRLQIFNRWGEIIWETTDMEASWNGTYPDGRLVQDGTYIWHLTSRDQINDEIFEYTGWVTVLK